jgi:hypothetical protein
MTRQIITTLSPDSSQFATWTWEARKPVGLRLWDVRTGKEIRAFADISIGPPRALFFLAGGRHC